MISSKILLNINSSILADLFWIINFQKVSSVFKLSSVITFFIDIIILIFQTSSLNSSFSHEWAVNKHRFEEFINITFIKIRHIRHDSWVIQEYDYWLNKTLFKHVFVRQNSTHATFKFIAERLAKISQRLNDYLQHKLSSLEDNITRLNLVIENILIHIEATDVNHQITSFDESQRENIFYSQHHQQTACQNSTLNWNIQSLRFSDCQSQMNHDLNLNQKWSSISNNLRVTSIVQSQDVFTDFRSQSEYSINNENVTDHFEQDSTSVSELLTTKTEFRSKNIEFFESNSEISHMKIRDKIQIYHNMFFFTNRLRIKSQFHSSEILCNRMNKCLLSKTNTWYN